MIKRMILLLAISAFMLIMLNVFVEASVAKFEDPVLEKRYWTLLSEFRCLVCQNQTLVDSNADLASDLRDATQHLLREGQSDEQIIAYMTERYGDFVLYRPPFAPRTLLLWLGPVLLLAVAGVFVLMRIRKVRTREQAVSLSEQERQRLEEMLASDKT